jgi:hypothetical protein
MRRHAMHELCADGRTLQPRDTGGGGDGLQAYNSKLHMCGLPPPPPKYKGKPAVVAQHIAPW